VKFEMIFYALALIGVILTGIGRVLLISEAASVSEGWRWAVRLLPLADIMFLARFWESAKTGAFLSLAGLICLMPLGGKALYERKHPKPVDTKASFGRLDGDRKNSLFVEIKLDHDARIAAKQRKLAQLNAHLAAWHQSIEQRRPGVASASPAEVAVFNEEAAAYSALHVVTREELEQLQKLLARKLDGWSSLTDDEYVAYLRKQEDRARKSRLALGPIVKRGGTKNEEL
jgi:hypothetical protein